MPAHPAERILIVDDESAQMKALCDTLRDHGYETVGFTHGMAALAALRERTFDLLLADLMMPEMDGIALLRQALEVSPDLVGIIMTGQGTIDTAVEAMKTGALDYILKPFRLSAVLPVLARALTVRRLRVQKAELEEHLRRRTAELEVVNRDLEAFSLSISHDLRAPLRAIDGFSSMLLEDHAAQLSSEGWRLLNLIIGNTRRMAQLIDDLLRFSRLGRRPLSRQPVQLNPLVARVVDGLRQIHAQRRIEIRVGDLPACVGDASLLEQVFANLLSNAFKFTRRREQAVIEVGCRHDAAGTVYFVRDNGVGFDMKYVSKLFGVFQRLHSVEDFDGTGVGLSIVQRIVERHGGRIWAEAALDQGAAFFFTLPQDRP